MKIYKIIALLIPNKKARHAFRDFFKYHLNLKKIEANYRKNLNRIKQQSKIKVAFTVWENCKWSYDSLFQKMKSDDRFEPIVCLINDNHTLCGLDKNKSFFDTKGYPYQIFNTPKEFKKFHPDIVFYEQPWTTLGNKFSPKYVSDYAVCLYVPYGIELDIPDVIFHRIKSFYLSLYKLFVFNATVQKKMQLSHVSNTVCSGHPRLDAYTSPKKPNCPWKSKEKVRIIYAPHHSFRHSLLKWATYEWSGDHLLHLAQSYADKTEWIFKPHPRFYVSLCEEFGQEYADTVFTQWGKVSSLYDQGDYFDLFKTADLMISDCGSFQVEWLPTGKPYINLVSDYPDTVRGLPLREHLLGGYYHAHNVQELNTYFHQSVDLKEDPLKSKRLELMKEIPVNAGDFIFNYVKKMVE